MGTVSIAAAPSAASPAPSPPAFERFEGLLDKKCRARSFESVRRLSRSDWRRRRFVLEADQLRWHSAKQGGRLRGRLQLQGVSLKSELDAKALLSQRLPPHIGALCFRLHDGQGRPLFLRVADADEKAAWVSKLAHNIYLATNPHAAALRSPQPPDAAEPARPEAPAAEGQAVEPHPAASAGAASVSEGGSSPPSKATAEPAPAASGNEPSTTWGAKTGNFPPPPPRAATAKELGSTAGATTARPRAATMGAGAARRGAASTSIVHAFAPWLGRGKREAGPAPSTRAAPDAAPEGAGAAPEPSPLREVSFELVRATSNDSRRSCASDASSEDEGLAVAGEATRSWVARRAWGRARAATVGAMSWSRRGRSAAPGGSRAGTGRDAAGAAVVAGVALAGAPRGGRARMESESV